MDIIFNIGFGILCFIGISFASCLIFLTVVWVMADIEKEKEEEERMYYPYDLE